MDEQALIVAAVELREATVAQEVVERECQEHHERGLALQGKHDAARSRVSAANARLMDLVTDRTHSCEGCGNVATNHRMSMYAGAIRYQCSECEGKAAALHAMLGEGNS
jgi:hypothetical protein